MHKVQVARVREIPEITRLLWSIGKTGMSTEHILDFDVWLVVKDREGKIIGCDALERSGKLLHGHSLAVAKEYRGQGVGSALVQYGFDHYVNRGDTRVVFTYFWNRDFYERLGFTRADSKFYKNVDDIGRRELHKSSMTLIRKKE